MPEVTGALTEAVFYILLALQQPKHGYGIMQETEELSSGRVRLAAGTLYGALSTMQEKGWIRAINGEQTGRKKLYEISSTGQSVLRAELDRLRELLKNGERILGGNMQ